MGFWDGYGSGTTTATPKVSGFWGGYNPTVKAPTPVKTPAASPTPAFKFPSLPSTPQSLQKDISSKVSTVPVKAASTPQPKLDPLASTVLNAIHTQFPLSGIVQNPKTAQLTPLGKGVGSLVLKTTAGINDPFNTQKMATPQQEATAQTKLKANPSLPNVPVPKNSVVQNLKESAGGPLAAVSFAGGGAPALVKGAQGLMGVGFGGQYLKNLPQTIQAIKNEPDPSKKLSMIVETLGGTALAGAGILHLGGVIKDLPTEKTVPGEKVSVPNEQAREFFNNPNPNIDKPTADLLTKALADNKQQFVGELRSGQNISATPDVTKPTWYAPLIKIIQGKMSRGEPLTPAEATVAQDISKNPEVYVPQKPAEVTPGTLYHGSDSGLLKVDDHGNINLGTSKEAVAQFGKDNEVPLKNLTVKEVSSPQAVYNIGNDPIQKEYLISQGVDIVKSGEVILGINPTKIAEKTGYSLRPSRSEQTVEQAMSATPQVLAPPKVDQIPVGSKPTEPPAKLGKITTESTTATPALAQGVKSKALKNKLIYGFDKTFKDLPEYEKVNVKEQGQKATELVLNFPEKAFSIAMGKEPPPQGVLPESVFVALENYAIETKNVEVLRQLATRSDLTQEATSMGQRIRMLAERDPDSATGAIKKVNDARIKVAEKKGKTVKAEAKKAIQASKAATPKVTKENWQSFIESIEC